MTADGAGEPFLQAVWYHHPMVSIVYCVIGLVLFFLCSVVDARGLRSLGLSPRSVHESLDTRVLNAFLLLIAASIWPVSCGVFFLVSGYCYLSSRFMVKPEPQPEEESERSFSHDTPYRGDRP